MRLVLLALSAAFVLSFSAAYAADPPVARAVAATRETTTAIANSANVILRPNDVFDLRLTGMPQDDAAQFNGAQTIGGDGSINILYVGRIQAAGKTPGELERVIEKELVEKKIFRSPAATVNIATGLRFVTVGGNVRGPARMPWSAELTILTALMAAGGPSDFGGDKISLVRGGKRTIYSYKKLRRDPSADPKLLPGDSVELL